MASTKKRKSVARGKKRAVRPQISGSFGEWLLYLGVKPHEKTWLPLWPPDVFAIVAAFFRRTGGYVDFIEGAPEPRGGAGAGDEPAAVGAQWRKLLEAFFRQSDQRRLPIPESIQRWWAVFCQPRFSFAEAGLDVDVRTAAWNLCIASDVACDGIGVRPDKNPFLAYAQVVLADNDKQSFCLSISPEKLAVLGKQHTPQRGCTIRSLTHNLALYVPSEMSARWDGPYARAREIDLDVLNLLLLPWPLSVSPADFSVVQEGRGGAPHSAHRYFDYDPVAAETPRALAARVQKALAGAREHVDRIHGIVLPELALDLEQYEAVERIAATHGALLISGVRRRAAHGNGRGSSNMCVIQPFGLTSLAGTRTGSELAASRVTQHKHHRWCLDRAQILQYSLGGRLPASHDCWERIDIGRRGINFVTLQRWLTICVLICEDLARQDPVTEVIRAVGPNLVFALLMDGPQLRHRWSSRYASVLAEDPGSSVLTFTSAGMAKRSKPRESEPASAEASPVVALWRDYHYGERELSIGDGHDACVLSLVNRCSPEFTLDGRQDNQAHFPVYAGWYSFSSDGGRS